MCWGAGSAGLTPSWSPESVLPPSDAPLWLDGGAASCQPRGCHSGAGHWRPLGRWGVSQWDPGCSSSMAPFSPSELVWTCGSWGGRFYSLTATCGLKTEQVLTSLSLLFWSVTWGHECAWAQPLLIAQPQTWAPPGSLAHPPPPAFLRSEPFFSGNSVHVLAYSGFTLNFVSVNVSLQPQSPQTRRKWPFLRVGSYTRIPRRGFWPVDALKLLVFLWKTQSHRRARDLKVVSGWLHGSLPLSLRTVSVSVKL